MTDCGKVRDYKRCDYFTRRLTYDLCTQDSSVVEKFVEKHDNAALAKLLLDCMKVSSEKRLTVISGPANSGKSAILHVIKALFAPYVIYGDSTENLGHIRTCLIDSCSLPTEEYLARLTCNHVVITTNNLELSGTYGGRKVTTFKIAGSLSTEETVPNLGKKLTTRKQLGCLLNWCLKNYEFPEVRSPMLEFVKFLGEHGDELSEAMKQEFEKEADGESDGNTDK